MPDLRRISDLGIPELEPYRTLRRPLEHQSAGIFVAESGKVVARMLQSGIEVISLLMTPEWHTRLQPDGDFPVYLAEQSLLESIVGFPLHQGIMGIGRIPQPQPLDALLQKLPHPWLIVALDGLEHAENVGVIVRNAAAFGAQLLLHDSGSSSPYLRRAVRNSMGAIFQLPVVQVAELAAALRELRDRHNVSVIGAHPSGEISISEMKLSGDQCLVLGNEGAGVSQAVLDACSVRVSIPMQNQTDSLNVASASAVFLYEIRRR